MSGDRHEWLRQPAPPWDPGYVPPAPPRAGPPSPPGPPGPEPPAGGAGGGWRGPALGAAIVLLVLVVSVALMRRLGDDDPTVATGSGATQQPWTGPAPTPTPPGAPSTPQTAPGGAGGAAPPGGQPNAVTSAIEPGIYIAMGSANIEGVGDDTALEFEVEGTGEDAKITYIVGFGVRATRCRPGAPPPSDSGTTFLDDEVTGQVRSPDGTEITTTFSDLRIHIEAESPGRVTGTFRFAFDGNGCRGRLRFVANRQRPGQPTLYDQVLQASR